MKPMQYRARTTLPARWKQMLAAVFAGVLAWPAIPVFADTADDYTGLPGKKALAVSEGALPVHGIAHSQAQDLAASQLALQDCEHKRIASSAPCELIRLNEARITSARELRDGLPAGPRPLYLWRYTSPGATVFLAGSVHFLKESLYPLPKPFEAAFNQADTLVVEVDLAALTPAELQSRTIAAGRLPRGQTLATVLSPELYERLSARLAGDGMDIVLFESLKPALVMNQLAVFGLMALGYSPQFGLEQHFTARKGRPVRSGTRKHRCPARPVVRSIHAHAGPASRGYAGPGSATRAPPCRHAPRLAHRCGR